MVKVKIEINQTVEDLVSFYQYDKWYSNDRKSYRRKTRVIWGLITTIPFWLIVLNSENGKLSSVVGLIIFGLFFFSLGFIGVKQTILSSWRGAASRVAQDKANKEFLMHKTLKFESDKIVSTTEFSRSECRNDTINKIRIDDKYYYLYNTSFSAYVIPKRIFKSQNEITDFEGILKVHFEHADYRNEVATSPASTSVKSTQH